MSDKIAPMIEVNATLVPTAVALLSRFSDDVSVVVVVGEVVFTVVALDELLPPPTAGVVLDNVELEFEILCVE